MLNAKEFDAGCDFEITGVSYVGRPVGGTAMFCVKKLEHLLDNLSGVQGCLVFIEQGMQPDAALRQRHCFVACERPATEYGRLTKRLWDGAMAAEAKRAYTLHEGGYTVGENVRIGEGVTIEPGVVIGHDVEIGDGSMLLMGAKIGNAVLGKGCFIKENAVIGCQAFTQYQEEDGSWHRLYNFGRVEIGDDVEVGACTTVCRGSADTTTLGDNVKLDDHVYIAHDVQVAKNVRMAAATTVGGYCTIGADSFIGFGATLRNRMEVGAGATVGMGSVVVKPVPAGATVYGNPAAVHEK